MINPRDMLDGLLMDLDVIAGPLSRGNRLAKLAARIFSPVIEETSRFVLPYIAVRVKLRGEGGYQENYLKLLKYLEIDTMGVPVPD